MAFLEAFERLGCDGTLVLEKRSNVLIALLIGGKLEASHSLGRFDALDSDGLAFHFEPHAPSDVPLLESRFPSSGVATLRAVPDLGQFERLPRDTDLKTLCEGLREDAYTGCLCLGAPSCQGLLLFYEGTLAAALCEQDEQLREGRGALRALSKVCSGPAAQLELRNFGPIFVRGLIGLALANRSGALAASTLEASEKGYTFFAEGAPVLRVKTELRGSSGRYICPDTLPVLELPDEPPGWEDKRYQLTLRGRDALNPMTELSLRFRDLFGREGRRMLELLEQGLTVERAAQHLERELGDLKGDLERLEQDGLIQALEKRS